MDDSDDMEDEIDIVDPFEEIDENDIRICRRDILDDLNTARAEQGCEVLNENPLLQYVAG